MNDLSLITAVETIERYLDELFLSGYYDESELAEFEVAWEVVSKSLKDHF